MAVSWVLVSKLAFGLLSRRALGGCLYLGFALLIVVIAVVALVVGLAWYELSQW